MTFGNRELAEVPGNLALGAAPESDLPLDPAQHPVHRRCGPPKPVDLLRVLALAEGFGERRRHRPGGAGHLRLEPEQESGPGMVADGSPPHRTRGTGHETDRVVSLPPRHHLEWPGLDSRRFQLRDEE
jgi:hypothetical protein